MTRKHKKVHDRTKPKKFCDPGVCDCCQYIGEGDFLCDKYMEIAVSDWEPTEYYLMCQNRDKAIEGGVAPRKDTGKVVVTRSGNGITLNSEREFLLDDRGEIKEFDSEEQAQAFLTAAGIEPEELRHMQFIEREVD